MADGTSTIRPPWGRIARHTRADGSASKNPRPKVPRFRLCRALSAALSDVYLNEM